MTDRDVDRLAREAYYGGEEPPSEVWWDSTKDAWLDGFETGYKAALGREIGTAAQADTTPAEDGRVTLLDVDHVNPGNHPAVQCHLCGETDGLRLIEGEFCCHPFCGRWAAELVDEPRRRRARRRTW